MSVVSVYRAFHWEKGRLTGQTGYVWETKEEQARCIVDALAPVALMSGVGMLTQAPRTKDQEQRDARYHIRNQHCLCGIHGYFSPNYLGLVTGTAMRMPTRPSGPVVFTRVRLGGLVDIHSMGARGEYGLIEEAWCDDDIVAEAVGKRYDIPTNWGEFDKQPRTDPIIDKDAKVVTLSSMFAGMFGAVAMKNIGLNPLSFGPLCQCGICAKVRARSPHTPSCPAPLGGSCLCGAHGPGGRGVLGSWKCILCGKYKCDSSDHTQRSAAPLKIVPVAPTIKPGIMTRLKRILGRAK